MNDTLKTSIDLLSTTVYNIENLCAKQQGITTGSFQENVNVLTNEAWVSLENSDIINEMNRFITLCNTIQEYYQNVSNDLLNIKDKLDAEMNKKENIHYM